MPYRPLIVTTMVAIIALLIQTGVGIGIVLSLLQGLWSVARAQPIERRSPSSTPPHLPVEYDTRSTPGQD